MDGICLKFENPIRDAISKIRFAPQSNNLLISSWDSMLRLYDVESSIMRLETTSGAALIGCCFQNESTAFSIGADFCVRRYNFDVGSCNTFGHHDDLATCIEYSEETSQVMSATLDKKICSWDLRKENGVGCTKYVGGEVESMSTCGFYLLVAIGTSVSIYDLRKLDEPVQMKETSVDYRIKSVCSFPNRRGYAVGSIDGRAALEFINPSDASEKSYHFRCNPKSKDGKDHLIAVNDIVFHPSFYGAFVTGDNDGYAIMWDAQSKKRLYQFPRYISSVASLSYNCGGELLAVASSYTCQEANEIEEPPHIFIHRMDEISVGSSSIQRSK
ncbi:hypothetical protein AQUCO_00600471v1 [Aquilegia coerulea]|uniref:Mitotic checkpoint protein BUB3.3 n=1 Tax=Aquilegia coerulea TaxID=218851 RepID=A0A2G5EPT1_AQUCA|nr:hypothetical protein AQUCO_00600471v1 [Aquilegia coerulea]